MNSKWATFLVGIAAVAAVAAIGIRPRLARPMVSSGRYLSPMGTHVGVGSFPCNMVASPDGRFLVVTDSGFREQLTVIEAETGGVTDKLEFNGTDDGVKDGVYYGLAFGEEAGAPVLYASRGRLGIVSRFSLSKDGKLSKLDGDFVVGSSLRTGPVAGVAYDSADGLVAAVVNRATSDGDHHGDVVFFDANTREAKFSVAVPGYPLDAAYVNGRVFVSCERDGVVVPIKGGVDESAIRTGANPTRLTPSLDGKSVFVANGGSDTVCEIDAATDKVRRTLLLRPASMRQLPISTPLAVAPSGDFLYVACGDLNAVAVVGAADGQLKGLIPTGWYPSAVAAVGGSLFVASAKGVVALHPNGAPNGPAGAGGQDSPNIIEGTVSKIDIQGAMRNLPKLSAAVLDNDRLTAHPLRFKNPGITHVIYIIKENRTYDQVFGDIKEGNGDPSLVMFGAVVTPNQHALATRFTLLDNFYDCAEVSADGWNWSTSGMVDEFTARNVPSNYSDRWPTYDFEGENSDLVPDLEGLTDVASAPGGYLWDAAARHQVSFRNFGFFVKRLKGAAGGPPEMEGLKRVLTSHTDRSFPEFDLNFADSDLWKLVGKTAKTQEKTFGAHRSTSRFDEWKREFDGFVRTGKMPALQFVRFMRDHTAGTPAGQWSPRAMVADNDYAVGLLVDAVSHSPFWKSTAICILEDDSQSGFDHVDCHRSTALLITPYMERGRHDSRFYNTDSMLRTIEVLLGMPPMNGFDATSDPIMGIGARPTNAEPYEAIVPSTAIAGEINRPTAYRAKDSARLIATTHEDSAADLQLNDILWGALMAHKPKPPVRGVVTQDDDGD
ncbi:MAG: bifunctional YncE family protein/alkaline phosphatase family protein [Fimbriimonadaceae bacterium]